MASGAPWGARAAATPPVIFRTGSDQSSPLAAQDSFVILFRFHSHPLPTPVKLSAACCFLICFSTTVGCGSAGGNLPKTVPASGVVTLDGKPVDGAQVILVPAAEGTTGAFGVTDSSGRFSLRAYDQKPGAIPGEYKVRVSKTIEVRGTGAKGSLDGGDPVRFEYGVPGKYTDHKMSGLTVTIPDTGNRDINLALSSK